MKKAKSNELGTKGRILHTVRYSVLRGLKFPGLGRTVRVVKGLEEDMGITFLTAGDDSILELDRVDGCAT